MQGALRPRLQAQTVPQACGRPHEFPAPPRDSFHVLTPIAGWSRGFEWHAIRLRNDILLQEDGAAEVCALQGRPALTNSPFLLHDY